MSSPVTITCQGPCGRLIFEGGEVTPDGDIVGLPFEDGQRFLTDFADEFCPVGGAEGGCPNVTPAVRDREEQQPEQLHRLILELRDRQPRGVTLPAPALTPGGTAEVPVTWPAPMPNADYQVVIGEEGEEGEAGRVAVAVQAGTRTTTACTLTVTAVQGVPEGAVTLHVVAIPGGGAL